MRNFIAWVGLLGVMTADGFAGPGRPADSQPTTKNTSAVRMPDEFNALLSRSVFVRKGAAAASVSSATKPSVPGLALRGVIRDEGGIYSAIVEDPISHQIQKIEDGATLAGGNVSHITLRGFQYEIGGKNIAVAIGQDLNGEAAVVAPPAPPAPAVAGGKGTKAQAAVPVDVAEQSPEAIQAALVAAMATPGDGGKPDAVVRTGVHRRGRSSNDN